MGRSNRSSNAPAQHDPLLVRIDALKKAEQEVRGALKDATSTMETVRVDRIQGVPLPQLAERALSLEGRDIRRRAAAAIAEYEHAMMRFRATIIRELVNEHELNFAEIARRMKISRQMVARLYRSEGGPPLTRD